MVKDKDKDAAMMEIVKRVGEAYAKREAKRDRAAIFVLNNFERVLDLIMDDSDDRAEDRIHDLRIDFYMQEQKDEKDPL